eukprot:Skav226331  [mRNA]  locus=scaffold4486:74102:79288:+ [translate_table: standard]
MLRSTTNRRCAHDHDGRLQVVMTQSQWQLVASKAQTILVFNARVEHGVIPIVDATTRAAGILCYHDSRRSVSDLHQLHAVELFAGGFSGWAHTISTLGQFGHDISLDVAVGFDANCAECYTKTHGSQPIYGPVGYDVEDPNLVTPCFILDNVNSPAWWHYLQNTKYDMLCMSPPCPPWSHINQGAGSQRQDGMDMYAAWALVGLIKPLVVTMENVSHLLQHPEWPQLKAFISSRGYDIKWCENLDLSQVLPQKRDRLMLIAVACDTAFALHAHRCIRWPIIHAPTLRTHRIIMDMILPWCLNVVPTQEVLNMYFDPTLMPNSNMGIMRTPKRMRHEVYTYRLRDLDSCFSCILTTYGHAHEMDRAVLNSGGLYGALLQDPLVLRFLQIPEVLCLFGPTNSVWLPSDPKKAIRVLGNSISVPHACIALVNCLAFLKDITMVETSELFAKVLAKRMHSGNIKQHEHEGGFLFTIDDEDTIPPTVPMKAFAGVTLTNGFETVKIKIEFGVPVHEVIKHLFGLEQSPQLSMQPMKQPYFMIPLNGGCEIKDPEIRIFVHVAFRLHVKASAFMNQDPGGRIVLVFSDLGITAMLKFFNMNIYEVENIITVLEQRTSVPRIVDSVGNSHAADELVPMAVMLVNQGLTDAPMTIFDDITMSVQPDGIHWEATREVIDEVRALLKSCGLECFVKPFGWRFVQPIDENPHGTVFELMLVPIQGRVRLCTQDMCNMLTLQVFLFQLRQTNMKAPTNNALVRFKMFGMWIWRGEIDLGSNLMRLVDFWEKARTIMHGPWGLRFVYRARALMPDIALREYCSHDDATIPVMDIWLQHGQHGGGMIDLKPAQPRTVVTQEEPVQSPPSPVSVVTHDMQELETGQMDKLQARLFEQWKRMPDQLRTFPMEEFDGLKMVMDDGMIIFTGELRKLITFNKHLKHSGIELILYQIGWLIALQFVEYGDPPEGRLLILPRPDYVGVSRALVRGLMQLCMVSMCMPPSLPESDQTCKIRIKLWDVWVYEGNLHRNLLSAELFQAYSRPSDLLEYRPAMRIICRGKMMIQEFPIGEYISPSPDSVNSLHFVLSLRGGGGSQPAPIWEAKHSIATAFVAAGANLKDVDVFVDQMVHVAGPTCIVAQCKPASITAKIANLTKLAAQFQIKVPDTSKQAAKAHQKVKDKMRNEFNRYEPHDLPGQVQLQEGYFRNDDGTPCQQVAKIQPGGCGIAVMSWDDALPWLQPPQQVSPDELGLLVLGECKCGHPSGCKKVTVPAFSAPNNPLILQGSLHQLGGKDIKIDDSKNTTVPVAKTEVLCVTAFRDELGEKEWIELCRSPIKYCLMNLQVGEKPMQLPTSPWGRSFQKDKQKTDPQMATSFQFHCRIPADESKNALRASGISGLYTTLKQEDKQVSQEYGIIWMALSTVEVQKLSAIHHDHRGIVRSTKSNAANRGLRFERKDFSSAWSKLKPNEDEPVNILSKFMFKLTPTPIGAQAQEIAQFLSTTKWKAKPVRAMSSNTWLCTAEEKYDETFLLWNGATILVKWLQSKQKSQSIIVAGDAPKKRLGNDDPMYKDAIKATAPIPDDWAAYRAKHGNHFAAVGSTPAPAHVPPRKVEAPLESRFQAQSDAIESLKQQSQEKIAQLQSDVTKLKESMVKTSETVVSNHQQINQDFASFRKETADQFTNMHNVFQKSLNQSMQVHEKHVSRQFDEIKDLLTSRFKTENAPRKAQKLDQQGNAMDDEEDKNL